MPNLTEYGPCQPWPVTWTCDISCESPAATGSAVWFGTEIAWALSGRQFGLCEITLRPCRRECTADWMSGGLAASPYPYWLSPSYPSLLLSDCGRCLHGCSCASLSEVRLTAPVHRIVAVRVDGAAVPTGSYQLYGARSLIRTDGLEWPACNDLTLPDTQVGTWSVTAEYGQSVPESGALAVGQLACEYLRAMRGDDCRLPRNVTQLVRQGVTISMPDVTTAVKEGLTGMPLVDQFIQAYNPGRLPARSRTYKVDELAAWRPT